MWRGGKSTPLLFGDALWATARRIFAVYGNLHIFFVDILCILYLTLSQIFDTIDLQRGEAKRWIPLNEIAGSTNSIGCSK